MRAPFLCLSFSQGCLTAMARPLYNLRSNQGHLRQERQEQPQATQRRITPHLAKHPRQQSLAVVFSREGSAFKNPCELLVYFGDSLCYTAETNTPL